MAALLLKRKRKRLRLGPYTRRNNLTEVDGRCKVARCMRDFARALEEHLGGNPSPAQKILIREASVKDCKLAMLVDRILTNNEPDLDIASRCYLAWSNSLRRDLEALGLKAPEQKLPQLSEFLAVRRGKAA